MKKLTTAVFIASVLGSAGVANGADFKNTASIGYAQTQLSGAYSGSMPGVNLKYHWEDRNSGFGAIGSFSYNKSSIGNIRDSKIKQISFLAGPSYRFNDYVSAYALLGVARMKADIPNLNNKGDTKFTYGAGIQINPMESWAIDASYQYARFDSGFTDSPRIKAGTWVVGVGYSF